MKSAIRDLITDMVLNSISDDQLESTTLEVLSGIDFSYDVEDMLKDVIEEHIGDYLESYISEAVSEAVKNYLEEVLG